MVENSSIIDALKSRVGEKWQAGVYPVERAAVQNFVRAIGDTNPRWQNDEHIPPTFIVNLGFDRIEQELAEDRSATLLHGATELECYHPVLVGDTLTVFATILDVRELPSRMGKTVFVTFKLDYTNQKQELVATCRQKLISY